MKEGEVCSWGFWVFFVVVYFEFLVWSLERMGFNDW